MSAAIDHPRASLMLFGALLLDHAPPWYAYLLPVELQSVLRRQDEPARVRACVRGDLADVASAALELWGVAADADLDRAIALLQDDRSEVAAHAAAALLSSQADRILDAAGANVLDRNAIWGAAEMDIEDSRLTRAEIRSRAAAAIIRAAQNWARGVS